jgi:hypothetical protein
MSPESLTKTLSLLIKLEWGVNILKVDAPFISTTSKNGEPIDIGCAVVSHSDGVIHQLKFKRKPNYLMLYIDNKSGNNLILISNKATDKLLTRDVSMRELAQSILYKNEIEVS